MKIGVIGANSRVGTELCFLLREEAEVVPIVRNRVAASTFDHHGFDYRVADVTDPADAESAIADLDVVIVAAFAYPESRSGFRPKRARRTNDSLVRNAINYARPDATVVYFSSIAAFGEEIGRSEWWTYVREKRHVEGTFWESIDGVDVEGYVLRLGLVFGPTQRFTRDLETGLSGSVTVVPVDPRSVSNVVHTVTIMDAITVCADSSVPPDTYTVVDNPQLTWEEVFERYAPDTASIAYVPRSDDGRSAFNSSTALNVAARAVQGTPLTDVFKAYSVYFPDRLLRRMEHTVRRNTIRGDIQEYRDGLTFSMPQFDYDPAPGPFLPGLADTSELLAAEARIDAFVD